MSMNYLSSELFLIFKLGHIRLHMMSGANHHTIEHFFHNLVIVQVIGDDLPSASLFIVIVWLQFNDSVPKSDIFFKLELFSV